MADEITNEEALENGEKPVAAKKAKASASAEKKAATKSSSKEESKSGDNSEKASKKPAAKKKSPAEDIRAKSETAKGDAVAAETKAENKIADKVSTTEAKPKAQPKPKSKGLSKIRVTQIKSVIDRPKRQKATMVALGLTRMNKTVEKDATPQVLGMVRKVLHLVKVEEL